MNSLSKEKSGNARFKGRSAFTLVELIVVIVILGILAAYVTGRFASVGADARVSVMTTLAASLKTNSTAIHGVTTSRGITGQGKVHLGDIDVAVNRGYATATMEGIAAVFDGIVSKEETPSSVKRRVSQNRPSKIVAAVSEHQIAFKYRTARNPETCKVVYQFNPKKQKAPKIEANLSDCY